MAACTNVSRLTQPRIQSDAVVCSTRSACAPRTCVQRPTRRCCACFASVRSDSVPGKVLVLGGTGFVGTQICQALVEEGYTAVTVSRRGQKTPGQACSWQGSRGPSVKRVQGDLVQDRRLVANLLQTEGPFCGVIHCVGMLLPNGLNALASGSGSVPTEGTTYDQITTQTACDAADALATASPGAPFVFVSAAEAGWSVDPPFTPPFLRSYLKAKRSVERHLDQLTSSSKIRAVVLRPSLIWTPARPAAIPPVAAFTVGSALGIPGVDKPVRVETLARAAVSALSDSAASGIWTFRQMQAAGPRA